MLFILCLIGLIMHCSFEFEGPIISLQLFVIKYYQVAKQPTISEVHLGLVFEGNPMLNHATYCLGCWNPQGGFRSLEHQGTFVKNVCGQETIKTDWNLKYEFWENDVHTFFPWAVFIVFIPKYVSIRSAKSCNADNFTSLIGVLCKVAEKIEWFVVTVLDKNN